MTKSQNACLAANYREKIIEQNKGRQGRKQLETIRSSTVAAKMFGIGDTSVIRATKIKVQAPILFKQVIEGTLTISQALRKIKVVKVAKINQAIVTAEYLVALDISLRELDDQ